MPKILRGRIAGLYSMESQTAEELHAWADQLAHRTQGKAPVDDPAWLRRWAKRIRCLAEQKDKARAHKAGQRKRRAP